MQVCIHQQLSDGNFLVVLETAFVCAFLLMVVVCKCMFNISGADDRLFSILLNSHQ
jgi:hypothetical protein